MQDKKWPNTWARWSKNLQIQRKMNGEQPTGMYLEKKKKKKKWPSLKHCLSDNCAIISTDSLNLQYFKVQWRSVWLMWRPYKLKEKISSTVFKHGE